MVSNSRTAVHACNDCESTVDVFREPCGCWLCRECHAEKVTINCDDLEDD